MNRSWQIRYDLIPGLTYRLYCQESFSQSAFSHKCLFCWLVGRYTLLCLFPPKNGENVSSRSRSTREKGAEGEGGENFYDFLTTHSGVAASYILSVRLSVFLCVRRLILLIAP